MATTTQHAVGTRKRAVAKVWLLAGAGDFVINGKKLNDYLQRNDLIDTALRPLAITDNLSKLDLRIQVSGGGVSAQAGAISFGIARALAKYEPDFHKRLKDAGLLTRDSREHERMKYGLAKRRKSFQWTKR